MRVFWLVSAYQSEMNEMNQNESSWPWKVNQNESSHTTLSHKKQHHQVATMELFSPTMVKKFSNQNENFLMQFSIRHKVKKWWRYFSITARCRYSTVVGFGKNPITLTIPTTTTPRVCPSRGENRVKKRKSSLWIFRKIKWQQERRQNALQ